MAAGLGFKTFNTGPELHRLDTAIHKIIDLSK